MYLLNDGSTLELTLQSTSAFASREERAEILRTVRVQRLPLEIRMEAGHRPAPVEIRFLAELIQTARALGRRVRFSGGARESVNVR